MNTDDAFLVLNALPYCGSVTVRKLLDFCDGDPLKVLNTNPNDLLEVPGVRMKAIETLSAWSSYFDLEREKRRLDEMGARFISLGNPLYPPLLKEIYDPPVGLYTFGNFETTDLCISVIGSRKTSLYGKSQAQRFGEVFAQSGYSVVSGLARGIDSEAHRGALRGGGHTVAVLGCGLDIIYPPENLELYQEIAKHGAVISEFPLGRRADKTTFPRRNRIVAGMSQAVVVVESDEKGGSMITARFAGEQGRQLFAVPGRVDQIGSQGCNQLIRDGATLVTKPHEVLEDLPVVAPQADRPVVQEEGMDPDGCPVLLFLSREGAATAEQLVEYLGQPASEVLPMLMQMEMEGLIAKGTGGTYERMR